MFRCGLGIGCLLALIAFKRCEVGSFSFRLLGVKGSHHKDADDSEQTLQVALLNCVYLSTRNLQLRRILCDIDCIVAQFHQLDESAKTDEVRDPHLSQFALICVGIQHEVVVDQERLKDLQHIRGLVDVIRLEQPLP